MDSRYSRHPPGRRSPPPLHLGRVSLPTTVGYGSTYDSDLYIQSPSRYDDYETIVSPRGHGDYHPPPPATHTTRTYAVTKDPLTRSSSVKEVGRERRSSTLDGGHQRPIVVMTEKHGHHHRAAGSHASHSSAAAQQPASPTRDPYRSSDEGQYYAQPASSIRSRHHRRDSFNGQPMSAALDGDDFARLRERQDSLLASTTSSRGESFGRARPPSLYSSAPRQGDSSIDYGADGFEYTNPSDLARYDLDHDQPQRRRRDSFDGRNYYRPSVSVSTELPRGYDSGRRAGPPPTTWGLDKVNRSAAGGIYDQPQIRMPVPPAIPVAPSDSGRRMSYMDGAGSPTERRGPRPRPTSVYQEVQPRANQHADLYRSHDDEFFELRRHQPEFLVEDDVAQRGFGLRIDPKDGGEHRRESDSRAPDDRRERRPPRQHDVDDREHRRGSDEDDVRVADRVGDRVPDRRDAEPRSRRAREKDDDGRERRARQEARPERRGEDDVDHKAGRRDDDVDHRAIRREDDVDHRPNRRDDDVDHKANRRADDARDRKPARDVDDHDDDDGPEDGDERERKSVRGKLATGLGIAAASIGIGSVLKKDNKADKDDRGSPKRRKSPVEAPRSSNEIDPELRGTADRYEPKFSPTDDRKPSIRDEPEILEGPKDRPPKGERAQVDDVDVRPVDKRAADIPAATEPKEPQTHSSEEEKTTPRPRRKRGAAGAAAFDPRDTAGLMDIKAKLAALDDKEKPVKDDATSQESVEPPTIREPPPERGSPSSPRKRDPEEETALALVVADKEGRGRELAPPAHDARQVRLVSPPRDEETRKPLRGILKAPKTKFPEEENPIREGVAPHKDDKTKQSAPNGARWTKVARKLVNPDALTIGKERFEVRDDFVIVLRVLSREEIEAYTSATAQLRGGLQPSSLLRFALFCP